MISNAMIFRIVIGFIFIAQYFFGGRYGQGNIFLLVLGVVFIAFGFVGMIQLKALRKKQEQDKQNKS